MEHKRSDWSVIREIATSSAERITADQAQRLSDAVAGHPDGLIASTALHAYIAAAFCRCLEDSPPDAPTESFLSLVLASLGGFDRDLVLVKLMQSLTESMSIDTLVHAFAERRQWTLPKKTERGFAFLMRFLVEDDKMAVFVYRALTRDESTLLDRFLAWVSEKIDNGPKAEAVGEWVQLLVLLVAERSGSVGLDEQEQRDLRERILTAPHLLTALCGLLLDREVRGDLAGRTSATMAAISTVGACR